MVKLPVLYAPLFCGQLDTNDDEVELARLFVRKADALVEHGPDFAEYIPVRRCRTCAKFEPPTETWPFWSCPRDDKLPEDGSGFCHKYEERER